MLEHLITAFRHVQFRGKAKLLNLVGPHSGVKRCKIFGLRFELDLDDFIQRQIYFGTMEPNESRLVRSYLKPGMSFVDVGANVGYYTAMAATLVGNRGRVVALEPSPYAFQRLQSMVRSNHLGHVHAIRSGLSDTAGEVNLYLGACSHNHTPTMVPHENGIATKVSVQTLDLVAERIGIDRIDLVKIDVEGYESRVLAGARRLLKDYRIRAILCEFNEHWLRRADSSTSDLHRTILDAGLIEAPAAKRGLHFENRFFQLP